MNEILSKFNLLDQTAKKEVLDFVDFLLSKKRIERKPLTAYKKKIQSVSTWADEELRIFNQS